MIRLATLLPLMLAVPVDAPGDTASVVATPPSGFDVTLLDVLVEEQPYSGETLVIVRVLAPAVSSPVLSGLLLADMGWACREWGLPRAETLSSPPDRIIVEFMGQRVPRGEPAPGIRQFFESYSLEGDACIWELF